MRSGKPLTLAGMAVALGLAGVVGSSYLSIQRLSDDTDRITLTNRAILELSAQLIAVVEIESAVRAYLVDGAESNLTALRAAAWIADSRSATLRTLMIRDTARIDSLAALTRQRIAVANGIVETGRQAGMADARRLWAAGEGALVQERIRDQVGQLQATQRVRLAVDQRLAGEHLTAARWGMVAAAVLAVLTAIGALAVGRHFNRREPLGPG